MKKVKHVAYPIQADSEQLAQSFPNLEQDSSKVAEINLDTEKILKLKTRIAEIVTRVDNLKASLQIFIAAKDAMEKIDSDKNDPFTRNDIDGEIKLIKRQIHYYDYVKFTNEVKIEALSTKEIHLEPEVFERRLLELRLQEKETRPGIQNLELAIDTLKRISEEFFKNPSKSSWEDYKIKECIHEEILLLEKEKSKNKSRLENIKEKIKILKEPKFNQNTSLVASHAKQLFFNGKAESDNSIPELKTQAIRNRI
jgi:chaperonin cofactor prefoldin